MEVRSWSARFPLRRWTNDRIEKKKFSCSTFMMYLGVEGTFDLPHHTIHISGEYEKKPHQSSSARSTKSSSWSWSASVSPG